MDAPTHGTAIPLPLSGGWDDRELVNAYDAALLEFHIHNPGPGSWLDKATAALAKGQPLPGANDFGTDWYAAAKRAADAEAAAGPKKYAVPHQPRKKARTATSSYAAEEAAASPLSPTYVPASPGGEVEDIDAEEEAPEAGEDAEVEVDGEFEGEADPEGDGDAEYDPMPEWDGQITYPPGPSFAVAPDPYVFPPPSGDWPAAVSRDAALGYALHAQYWAGYWMGVARGAGRGQPGVAKRKRKGGASGANGSGSGSGSGSGNANGAQSTSTPSWARGNGVSGLRR